MSKFKSNLIKLSAVVFALCLSIAIAFMPKTESVDAATGSFKIFGTSIRLGDDGYTGLKYEFNLDKEWYQQNASGKKMTVGTLIFPAYKEDGQLQQVDTSKSSTDNMKRLDGDNLILEKQYLSEVKYNSSIVFDDQFIEQAIIDKYKSKGKTITDIDEDEFKVVKKGLYAKEFTAYPYVIIEGKTVWGDAPYTTSMQKVAAQTLVSVDNDPASDPDGKIKTVAKKYLGLEGVNNYYYDGYVTVKDNKVVVDGIDGYQVNDDAIVALGNVNATVANGEIILNGTFTASKDTKKLFIFEEGTTKIIDLSFVDNVLSSPEELAHYFNPGDWAEGENLYTKVTVLANDVDMSGITIPVTSRKNFTGMFDGRGRAIFNLTKDMGVTNKGGGSGLFGNMQDNCIIRNVAFADITTVRENINDGLISQNLRGTFENVYLKHSATSTKQQMFLYTKAGYMTNVVIETPYDPSFNVADYLADVDDKSLICRMMNFGSKMTNVQVISQAPIVRSGAGAMNEPYDSIDKEGMLITEWVDWFGYGENETELWYKDFKYFYSTAVHETFTGLGLKAGTADVNNTQVFTEDGVPTGKTRVWTGVRRYNTVDAMNGDVENKLKLDALVATGMWSYGDNGKLVWAKNKGANKPVKYIYDAIDYDASTGELRTAIWLGEQIQKITLDGVVLTDDVDGGLIKDVDNIIGIRAKVNMEDPLPGIRYTYNRNNDPKSLSYDNTLIIETNENIYSVRKIQYWTVIIHNEADLKKAMAYDVDYTTLNSTDNPEILEVTEREIKYNGKGLLPTTSINGSVYYKGIYNVGIYKIDTDIDMKGNGIGYVNNPNPEGTGGFAGYLDGFGHSIKNFKPGSQGLLGAMNIYITGHEVNYIYGSGTNASRSIPFSPTIKNVAFEEVITTASAPVITSRAGHAQDYGSTCVYIQNIYITVSSQSTGFVGIAQSAYRGASANNIYIVDYNEYSEMQPLDNTYRIATREGVTVDPNAKYIRPCSTSNNNSALYGNVSSDKVVKIIDVVENVKDVYIVSKCPVTYYNAQMAGNNWHAYVVTVDSTSKMPVLINDYLRGYNSSKGKKLRSIGYASNETQGNILVPYQVRPNVATEINTNYALYSGTAVFSYNFYGYFCTTCGEVTLGAANKNLNKTDCPTDNCDGLLVKNYGSSANGFWNSPVGFEWTVHNVATEAGNDFTLAKGVFKYAGVKKYNTAELLPQGEENYTNFLGAAGNGMWGLDSDNRLVWVGA